MFEPLTKYLDTFTSKDFMSWIKGRHYDEYDEGHKDYRIAIERFEEEIYSFFDAHPEFDHYSYGEVLKKAGMKGIGEMKAIALDPVKIKRLPTNIVAIVLFTLVRMDHMCDGAYFANLRDGYIQIPLKELKERDLL